MDGEDIALLCQSTDCISPRRNLRDEVRHAFMSYRQIPVLCKTVHKPIERKWDLAISVICKDPDVVIFQQTYRGSIDSRGHGNGGRKQRGSNPPRGSLDLQGSRIRIHESKLAIILSKSEKRGTGINHRMDSGCCTAAYRLAFQGTKDLTW